MQQSSLHAMYYAWELTGLNPYSPVRTLQGSVFT